MKIFTPPAEYPANDKPSVFLAGPIQDGPDWQAKVADGLWDLEVDILNPRSPDPWHGDWVGQVHWETVCLRRANLIVFWLASPAVEPRKGRAYAQTTRFELGEWVARAAFSQPEGTKAVVVGAEPGFSGERYIRSRLTVDYGIRVHDSLAATITDARKNLERICRMVQMERGTR